MLQAHVAVYIPIAGVDVTASIRPTYLSCIVADEFWGKVYKREDVMGIRFDFGCLGVVEVGSVVSNAVVVSDVGVRGHDQTL
jgi:hypothetical protein